ncbi:MAG: anthranilate synthase component I [candidate division KSB1 bacterium]|nr:anthranilate synthase component I [candidate division KSB1 bacterium]
MQPPSFAEFQRLAMHGNVIPVATSLLADMLTPAAAFLRLCGHQGDGFLLESVEGGETLARFSFLGRNAREVIRFDGQRVRVQQADGPTHAHETDIFAYLQNRLRRYQFVPNPELPRFSGGMVGYFGYDTVRLLEALPGRHALPGDTPMAEFGFYDTILAFDHLRHRIIIITNVFLEDGADLKTSYTQALERLEETRTALKTPFEAEPRTEIESVHANVVANFQRDDFCEAVRQAKDYIRAGDIFQVVLSQKFTRPVAADPFDVYRALRLINPSPYMYFLRQNQRSIIGSSPELMVRVEQGEVVVRPIAGTRPRGRNAEEDDRLAAELLADEKERAEHVMLVDLGRNDIGRVARFGEVRVSENMIIEKYSHVMHIVSEVRGRLRHGLDAIDAFRACFPAGTVTGAPKVRAMEIIEELEPEARGLYAGALGYLDFSGNLDTCIAIRTLEIHNGTARFQAGAGIVADSIPEREYAETIHKSNAIRHAIALAESGFEGI